MSDERERQLQTLRRLRQLEEDEARAGLAIAESARAIADEELRARRDGLAALDAERVASLEPGTPLDPVRMSWFTGDALRAAERVDERAAHLRICDERCALERDQVTGAVRQRHVVERVEARHEAEAQRIDASKAQDALIETWLATQGDDNG